MSDLRKIFESSLSERVKIILIDCDFNNSTNRYHYFDLETKDDFNLGVINGAWFMFFEDYEKQRAKTEHLHEMNQRYIGKMQEQQDQIAELEKSIQKMKLDHCAYKKGIRKVVNALRGADDINLSS